METHGGPFRGPISGGLPGALVSAFAIVLFGGVLWFWTPFPVFVVWAGLVVVALAMVWLRSR